MQLLDVEARPRGPEQMLLSAHSAVGDAHQNFEVGTFGHFDEAVLVLKRPTASLLLVERSHCDNEIATFTDSVQSNGLVVSVRHGDASDGEVAPEQRAQPQQKSCQLRSAGIGRP